MNKVVLIGRLTKDPEMRTTQGGLTVTRFTVAVDRTYTGQNGEKGADFISCVAWRRQAENIAKYCKKGTQVAVDGRIQTGSYDHQDGTKRYTTEIIADNVTFLGSKSQGDNSNQGFDFNDSNSFENAPSNTSTGVDVTEDPFKDFGDEIALSDDDLPF